MLWNEFLSWRCAQPSRVGRFLLVMADAYLCAMPMTYELMTRKSFSVQLSGNSTAEDIDATGSMYYGITFNATPVTVRVTYLNSGTWAQYRLYWQVYDGVATRDGPSVQTGGIKLNSSETVTVPAFTYEGPLSNNTLRAMLYWTTADHPGNRITITFPQ